jgi:hypothetical protein
VKNVVGELLFEKLASIAGIDEKLDGIPKRNFTTRETTGSAP